MFDSELSYRLLDADGVGEALGIYRHIYIYGAGAVGHALMLYLDRIGLFGRVESFLVSSIESTMHKLGGKCVKSISNLEILPNSVIVLAATDNYRKEMIHNLDRLNYSVSKYEIVSFDYPIMRFKNLPQEKYQDELGKWYFENTQKSVDFKKPKSFNEKIQWMKLYEENDLKSTLSDKYLVRKYISENIGSDYLIPLIGFWNSFEEINWDEMPEKFVLKCNHGSGLNAFVNDKKDVDLSELKKSFTKWMNIDYSLYSLERQYHNICRKILAEEYLEDPDGDLRDFKFWCFNGCVMFIQVDINRFKNHKRNIYTREWEYLPYSIGYPNDDDVKIDRPSKLSEMISISEKLSKGFNHVRVDLYYTENRIYFGEMTFTHGGGVEKFDPPDFGYVVGSWMNLI